ncbi:MAG: beta-propeller fold lactonase family protein [Coxiellaceae bacterium]|nr:beta-propeller fold lactonase family protein [Coxiellaceae bacterium]
MCRLYYIALRCILIIFLNTPLILLAHQPAYNLHDILKLVPANSHAAAGITITGSGGTIRYVRAYFYSDSSCASGLLASGSIVDNQTGFAFTVGQTIKLSGAAAYQLITSQQLSANDIASISCMKLIYTEGNESSEGVDCQTFSNYTCSDSSCSTTSGAQSTAWKVNPSICAPMHLYVARWTDNLVSKCDIDSATGALSNCTTTGSEFKRPAYVALNNGYAYSTDSSADRNIHKFTVALSTGALSDVKTTTDVTSNAFKATVDRGLLYVPNFDGASNGRITECDITASDGANSGDIGSCAQTAVSFTDPIAVKINVNHAYIADFDDNDVHVCGLNSDGTINTSDCIPYSIDTGGGDTAGITFHYGFAYIPMTGDGTIQTCDVNTTTGALSNCGVVVVTGQALSAPRSIVFYKTHAYVANLNANTVNQCEVLPSSTNAIDCPVLQGTPVNAPYGLSIY